MAEFKTKEEYEKWKAEKAKQIGAPSVNSSATSKSETKIPESSPKPNKLQNILFVVFSILAFLGLFDNFAYIETEVISIWYGVGIFKGLSLSIGISVLIVLILNMSL